MEKAKMNNNEIHKIASNFRKAIIIAKNNGEFSLHDRMSRFPYGCCDDACDLLAYYLFINYNIHTKQGNGVYRDNDFYNTTNHAWLILNGDTVIDITGDQFAFAGFSDEVYVRRENSFYQNLEDKRILDNYDITQSERLWNDYKSIIKYMPTE